MAPRGHMASRVGRGRCRGAGKAGVDAVRRMAWELTLRFATASLELAPSYMGHACSAAALAELGDSEKAEAHLLAARDLVDDPSMLAWNTISLADVWFYHGGRMEDALELVRKELAQTTDPGIRDEVSSALAINLMMYGNIQEVVELSRDVLERPTRPAARFMALVASTSADGLNLRPGEVHPVSRQRCHWLKKTFIDSPMQRTSFMPPSAPPNWPPPTSMRLEGRSTRGWSSPLRPTRAICPDSGRCSMPWSFSTRDTPGKATTPNWRPSCFWIGTTRGSPHRWHGWEPLMPPPSWPTPTTPAADRVDP